MKRLGYNAMLICFAVSVYAGQSIVTLAPAKDNTLYQSTDGSLSDGKGDFLFAGKTATGGLIRRAVLQFDIASAVPKGSIIVSAMLTLHMSKSIAGATPVVVYRLSSDWGEGTSNSSGNEGGGTASTTGDATWMHAFYSTALWKTPGGDYAASAGSTLSVGGIGSYSWPSTPALVADVQQWLDTPAVNYGWIVIGDESANATAKRFESRDNATAANRPSLKITYNTTTSVPAFAQVV
ncbi:MAG: DNRLRE domain-containing protein, partial [Ignavibacteriales bacterium]|nr:DNRLRE domain-containing protein [Ignavibacteriales bacterium]